MTTNNRHFVTQKGLDRLHKKIALMKERLKAIQEEKAHAYSASGDGWHDNPGWLQLGQQEEQLSADIIELERRLTKAIIFEGDGDQAGKVSIGSKVSYQMEPLNGSGRTIEMTIEIVGSGESNIREKLVSYDSPVGAALSNMEVGQTKTVDLPNGSFLLKVKCVVYD